MFKLNVFSIHLFSSISDSQLVNGQTVGSISRLPNWDTNKFELFLLRNSKTKLNLKNRLTAKLENKRYLENDFYLAAKHTGRPTNMSKKVRKNSSVTSVKTQKLV